MSSVLDSPLVPGTVLAGKYRIERVIGQGGMGIVAAAQHIQLEQRVALKLMLPHAMMNSDAVSRFIREARAAARISSEHVARVYDVGALDTGEPYIAMEYLEGSDIAALIAARGRLPLEEAVDYLLQGAEALAEAHAAGIVHRDLKPANLFLVRRRDGQSLVKVLDFGISKVSGSSGQSNAPVTATSALMGSPLYMSPEQMGSAKAVDARSDIWALGVVLYEMLCGTAPFNGETLPQVCAMVMAEAPEPLEARAPGLPPRAYEVVRRCLEKQPSARYQSVAELAQALESVASPRGKQSVQRILHVQGVSAELPPTAAPVSLAAAAATGPSSSELGLQAPPQGTYAPWGETKPPPVPPRRGAAWFGLGASALVLLAAGAGWVALRAPHETPSAAASAPQPAPLATSAATSPPPIAEPIASVAPGPSVPASATASPSREPSRPAVVATERRAKPPAARPSVEVSKAASAAAPPVSPVPASPATVSTRSRL